ncbi:MAG TPA: TrbI/VirB10 family protein [Bryobacteraceae bacterium]|jgi:type IV secretion system protein VirB10|nr:TrbI/VirB10 family protein [Bryobacteraceae bacterium]
MPDTNSSAPEPEVRSLPDPQGLLPQGGLTNRHKRWMFFAAMAIVLVIVMANLVATGPHAPPNRTNRSSKSALQQNPTPAQIQDMENTLRQQETALLEDAKRKQEQIEQARAATQAALPPGSSISADDLQRAAALQEAAQARAQYEQMYGGTEAQGAAQRSQIQAQKEQQAYQSLFADNVVRQEAPPTTPHEVTAPPAAPVNAETSRLPAGETRSTAGASERQKQRQPLDFNPATQQNYWLPEGTVMEAVLTDRLDGDAPGPVNCMITTDVYLPGTRLILIPQGARVLGEASKVSSFGQQRLAVAFHRILIPGLNSYSIPLDKEPPALAQAGEVGLHDKVNNHYFSIFGASLAVGAIGGLAQIGNGYSGFGYDPSVSIRNGVSQSMAESSDRILDRFLNRMPTISIREGTRVKILLTGDLEAPAFDSMHTGGS